MSSRAQIDFNDLTNLLAAEINAGIKYTELDVKRQPGFKIDSIKVSLGQVGCDDEIVDPEEAQGDETEGESFLNKQLYALADKGWNYEMIVSSGTVPVNVRIVDLPDDVIKPELPRSAIEIFKNENIKAIKGVDKYWQGILNKYGLKTIADVFNADIEVIYKIVESKNNLYPLNIYSKVAMINISVPVVSQQLKKKYSFYEMLQMNPGVLVKNMGGLVSNSAAIRIILFMSRLYTILDGDVLKDKYL